MRKGTNHEELDSTSLSFPPFLLLSSNRDSPFAPSRLFLYSSKMTNIHLAALRQLKGSCPFLNAATPKQLRSLSTAPALHCPIVGPALEQVSPFFLRNMERVDERSIYMLVGPGRRREEEEWKESSTGTAPFFALSLLFLPLSVGCLKSSESALQSN